MSDITVAASATNGGARVSKIQDVVIRIAGNSQDGIQAIGGFLARLAGRSARLEETPFEQWERTLAVNLTGTFIVNQAVGRAMKQQKPDSRNQRGSIVNIASINSFISLTEVLAYAASKSGVLGIVRGLANEWGPYGIRVNGIAPGIFPTDLNRPLIEGTPRGDWLRRHTPLDRFGDAGLKLDGSFSLFLVFRLDAPLPEGPNRTEGIPAAERSAASVQNGTPAIGGG